MPQSDAIIWNVDPVLFQIGPLTIRYYGILFALSFFIGYNIIRSVFKREGKPESDLATLLKYMMVGTIAGAAPGALPLLRPGILPQQSAQDADGVGKAGSPATAARSAF